MSRTCGEWRVASGEWRVRRNGRPQPHVSQFEINCVVPLAVALFLAVAGGVRAGEPILRLESQEPMSLVTATTFGPDGRLYVCGFDKVVRSRWPDERGQWQPANSYRVPIGPGIAGALNDAALSADGRWLAAGGNGWFKRAADFRSDGALVSRNALDLESKREIGAVYLFDRPVGTSSPLKHHAGPAIALSFDGQTLATLAWEFGDKQEIGEYTVAVWDALSKRLLAQTKLAGVPPPIRNRPAFLVRRLSPAETDVAVVAAFGKETVHVWRPARERDWTAVPVGAVATSLLPGPRNSVRVACLSQTRNRLAPAFTPVTLENVSVGEPLFVPTDGLPNGLIASASISSDGATTAFIYHSLEGTGDHWLCALNAAGAVIFKTKLQKGAGAERVTSAPPRVAISPDGSQAAVALPDRSEFRLYALTKLDAEPTAFSGARSALSRAQFVEKNGEHTVQLHGAGRALVLDPVTLKMEPTAAGSVKPIEHQRGRMIGLTVASPKIELRLPNGGGSTIAVEGTITAAAAFQPNANGPPFVAVGMLDQLGQSELRIYRADTGEQVRRCTAHTGPIIALHVSSDGGLLLSSSYDRNIGLWNLADLEETVGGVGAVRGVALDDARKVVASDVEALQVGDVVVGRTIDDRFQTFASTFGFLTAAKGTKPGGTLLVVAERNGRRFDVGVPVVQGMDERKPLAQLYCKENGEWIAWSPFGPYDSNCNTAEEWIGWHFNPEGETPCRFALGGQYRQQYRRPGLLRRLIQTRSLTAALDAWRRLDAEPPDPGIALSLAPVDLSRQEATVVPKREVLLTLRITNADFPLERLATLEAAVDGEVVRMERKKTNEYQGALNFKKPGRHVVRMSATTSAPLSRRFDEERVVLFAPPAPTLEPTAEWIAASKAKSAAGVWSAPNQESAEFRLQTQLAADAAFGAMALKMTLNGEPLPEPKEPNDLRIPLQIGENRIVVSAAPRTTFESVAGAAEMVVVVRRTEPPKTYAPPIVVVDRIEVDGKRLALPPSGTMKLERTAVRVVGTVSSEEDVAGFQFDGKPAAGFQSGKRATFAVDRTLAPGVNRIRLSAKGKSGALARRELTLECIPTLPIASVELDANARDLQWTGVEVKSTATVRFQPTPENLPVAAALKHNGVVVAKQERTANAAETWSVPIVLAPGENKLVVELEAGWGKTTSQTATLWRRRPPKLLSASSSPVGVRPFVDLSAEVEALDGWPPTELAVNGRVHQQVEKLQSPPDAKGVVRWKLLARNVALEQGSNRFVVAVRNAEGESSAQAVEGVVYAPPPPPKAQIAWEAPGDSLNRDRPELDVVVRVRSTTHVSQFSFGAGQAASVGREAAPVFKTGPNGEIEIEIRRRIALTPGRTALAIRVVNEGGEAISERVVNYVPPPALLRIVGLENPKGKIEPVLAPDGTVEFGAAATGKQTLVGEVAFAESAAPNLKTPASVRVFVNGLQQQTVELGPAEGAVRRFRAPVALNQKRGNRLFAEIVGLSIDADCNAQATVKECAAPLDKKRLHVVLIGVGENDENKLQAEAKEAFQAAVEARGFERILQRHTVCGYVTAPSIREAVDKLRMELVEGSARQDAGDVVVFYFRGQGMEDQQRLKLLTSEPAWMARSKFDAGDLATRFADVPGAQLLLLDVALKEKSDAVAASDQSFKRPNAALFGFRRPPKEAPLLFTAFKEAFPKIANLGELQQRLTDRELPPGVTFDKLFPPQLGDLVVRGE